jgi:hypothetical protein
MRLQRFVAATPFGILMPVSLYFVMTRKMRPCYHDAMTDLMEKALAVIGRWPVARQDEAAEMLLALDRLGETYVASDDELAAIDEALAQIGRGEFAAEADVEAAFARFGK